MRQGEDQNHNRHFCAKLFSFSNVKNSLIFLGKVARPRRLEAPQSSWLYPRGLLHII